MRKLIAADIFVERFSINERTSILLGSAIARFGDKYLGVGYKPSLERCMWSTKDMGDLVNAIPTPTVDESARWQEVNSLQGLGVEGASMFT
jgi:hypothetical protein